MSVPLLLRVLLACSCALALATGTAMASSAAQSPFAVQEPLPVPGAFRLSASNGYTLYVIAAPPHAGRPASLLIFASAKGRGVSYFAPATVTGTSMESDLGGLGRISVSFHRTGQPAIAHCGKKIVRFDSGRYEGTIVFHGEGGYTSAEATSAAGNIDYLLSVVCGGVVVEGGSSGHSRGAELFLRNPGLGARFRVAKSGPGAAAQATASISEFSSGISIERFATMRIPSEDFTYDRRLRTATVRPPLPFTGSARFDFVKKAGQRWSGDLTVDLPGRSGVPLTGPTLRAYLVPLH